MKENKQNNKKLKWVLFVPLLFFLLIIIMCVSIHMVSAGSIATDFNSLPVIDIRREGQYITMSSGNYDVSRSFHQTNKTIGYLDNPDTSKSFADVVMEADNHSRLFYGYRIQADAGQTISIVANMDDTVLSGGEATNDGQRLYWCIQEWDIDGNMLYDGEWRQTMWNWQIGITENEDTNAGMGWVFGVNPEIREEKVTYVTIIFRINNGNTSIGSGDEEINAEKIKDIFKNFYIVYGSFRYVFDANGGTIDGNSTYINYRFSFNKKYDDIGKTDVEFPTPTRKGYVFNGWEVESSSNPRNLQKDWIFQTADSYMLHDGKFYSTFFGDVTLKARWERADTFSVYLKNGGEGTNYITSLDYNERTSGILDQNRFSKYGYAFAGWKCSMNSQICQVGSQRPYEDLDYKTQFITAADENYAVALKNNDYKNYNTEFILWESNANDEAQQFVFDFVKEENGVNYWVIRHAKSGMVLDVNLGDDGEANSGDQVKLWSYYATDNQLWTFEVADDNGNLYIRSKLGDYYLDATGGTAGNGVVIEIWEKCGSAGQKWKLPQISIELEAQWKMADIFVNYFRNSSKGTGNDYLKSYGSINSEHYDNTDSFSRTGFTASGWEVWEQNGTYRGHATMDNEIAAVSGSTTIRPKADISYALDVKGGNFADGTDIESWLCLDNAAQGFSFEYAGSKNGMDYWLIRNTVSGKVLEVRDGTAEKGTQVVLDTFNGSDSQLWTLEQAGDGYVYIKSRLDNENGNGNLYMNISNNNLSGGNIIVWEMQDNADNSTWALWDNKLNAYVQWAAEDVPEYTFTVKHFVMDMAGNYPETPDKTNEYTVLQGMVTPANYKSMELEAEAGVHYNHAEVGGAVRSSVYVDQDGMAINLYYTRDKYKVTLKKGTGIRSVSADSLINTMELTEGTAGYAYVGTEIKISAAAATGYQWKCWNGNIETYINNTSYNDREAVFTMPAKDVLLTAAAEIGKYNVIVKHYVMGTDGNYPGTLEKTETLDNVQYGTVLKHGDLADAALEVPDAIAFDPDKSGTSLTVRGSCTIIVYYKRFQYCLWTGKRTGIESVSDEGYHYHYYGEEVTVTAQPGRGYAFDVWKEHEKPGISAVVNDNICNTAEYIFTMPAKEYSIAAYAVPMTCYYNIDPNGGTYTFGGNTYTEDTIFGLNYADSAVIPLPEKEGYCFNGWEIMFGEDEDGTDSTYESSTHLLTMGYKQIGDTGLNVTFKANWSQVDWSVVLTCNPNDYISATCTFIGTTSLPLLQPKVPEHKPTLSYLGDYYGGYNTMEGYLRTEINGKASRIVYDFTEDYNAAGLEDIEVLLDETAEHTVDGGGATNGCRSFTVPESLLPGDEEDYSRKPGYVKVTVYYDGDEENGIPGYESTKYVEFDLKRFEWKIRSCIIYQSGQAHKPVPKN